MRNKITKEEIRQLPLAVYEGEIHVVDTAKQVKPAIDYLRTHSVVGMDTESRPTFTKGERQGVALIQLATPEHCYLFRLNKIGVPKRLADFIADPTILKVGLDLCGDRRVLRRNVPGLKAAGFVDLQRLTPAYGIQDLGLKNIYAILFGAQISKSAQLTNWEAPTLTDKQQHYAALDAAACLSIYRYLEAAPRPLLHHFGLCPDQ